MCIERTTFVGAGCGCVVQELLFYPKRTRWSREHFSTTSKHSGRTILSGCWEKLSILMLCMILLPFFLEKWWGIITWWTCMCKNLTVCVTIYREIEHWKRLTWNMLFRSQQSKVTLISLFALLPLRSGCFSITQPTTG